MKYKKRSFTRTNFTRNLNGFTLIELLISIGIISFLIITLSIAIDISAIRRRTRDAKRINDLKKLATAMEGYFHVNGQYPPNLNALSPNFIQVIPVDPLNTGTYTYTPVTNGTHYNVSTANGIIRAYMLSTQLEDTTNPNARKGCDQCSSSHNYCVAGGGAAFGAPC